MFRMKAALWTIALQLVSLVTAESFHGWPVAEDIAIGLAKRQLDQESTATSAFGSVASATSDTTVRTSSATSLTVSRTTSRISTTTSPATNTNPVPQSDLDNGRCYRNAQINCFDVCAPVQRIYGTCVERGRAATNNFTTIPDGVVLANIICPCQEGYYEAFSLCHTCLDPVINGVSYGASEVSLDDAASNCYRSTSSFTAAVADFLGVEEARTALISLYTASTYSSTRIVISATNTPTSIPYNTKCPQVCKDAYSHLIACSEYGGINATEEISIALAGVSCVCTPEQVTNMRACADCQGSYSSNQLLPLHWLYFCEKGHVDVMTTRGTSAYFSTATTFPPTTPTSRISLDTSIDVASFLSSVSESRTALASSISNAATTICAAMVTSSGVPPSSVAGNSDSSDNGASGSGDNKSSGEILRTRGPILMALYIASALFAGVLILH